MREALKALGEDEEEPENENAEADNAKMEEDIKINTLSSNPQMANILNVMPMAKEDTDMISSAAEYIKSKRGTAMEDID